MIDKLEYIKALNGMPEVEWRFWAKVDTNGPIMPGMNTACWIWKAGGTEAGYGLFNLLGKMTPAHRCAWLFACGEVLSRRIVLMHQCDNPPCVNPLHLKPGTHFENAIDMSKKGRASQDMTPKLTREIAREARLIYQDNEVTQSELAKRYGISTRAMHDILSNKTYRE